MMFPKWNFTCIWKVLSPWTRYGFYVRSMAETPSVPDRASLEHRFVYRDFPQFIKTWIWKNQFLREYEDFTFIAEAIDLAAQHVEQAYPPEPFAAVYNKARQIGFHTTAHAGEGAGAESICGALRGLHAERIGHGTRAFEDETLLDFLAEQNIALEMCPISNVRTAVVPDIVHHPIRGFFERGILVTVNTDDPKMFGTSLAKEYETLADSLGFSPYEIRLLIENAVRASWLPESGKWGYLKRIREYMW